MDGAAGHSCDNRGTGEPQDMKKVGELIQGMSRIERLLHAVHWSLTLEPGSCNDYREEDAQPCDDGCSPLWVGM